MSDDDYEVIDVRTTPGSSRDSAWRAHAVRLAARVGLVGQVQRAPSDARTPGVELFRCISTRTPTDHYLMFFRRTGEIICDCTAAGFGNPCSHAGATLLLIAGLAPERRRTPEGDAP